MKLTRPPLARKGDKVYIISPSAGLLPFTANRVERGVKNLSALGLEVVIAPNAAKNSGYVSSSVQERINDIHQAFQDKDCSIIMAAIGGNHSNQLLSGLDYTLVRNNPKIFIGYSDNTVLHYAFATQSGLQTYYGPCFLNQFGEFPEVLPFTLEWFKKMLFENNQKHILTPSSTYTDEVLDWFKDEDSKRPRKLTQNSGPTWWRSGEIRGWTCPGAIPSFSHLIGTKYCPDFKGAVLMLDIPEGNNMHDGLSVAEFDSWLTDFETAEILPTISGMVISRPYKYDADMVKSLKKAVLNLAEKYDFPVVFNLDFGHTDPMITIPIGSKIVASSDSRKIIIS